MQLLRWLQTSVQNLTRYAWGWLHYYRLASNSVQASHRILYQTLARVSEMCVISYKKSSVCVLWSVKTDRKGERELVWREVDWGTLKSKLRHKEGTAFKTINSQRGNQAGFILTLRRSQAGVRSSAFLTHLSGRRKAECLVSLWWNEWWSRRQNN